MAKMVVFLFFSSQFQLKKGNPAGFGFLWAFFWGGACRVQSPAGQHPPPLTPQGAPFQPACGTPPPGSLIKPPVGCVPPNVMQCNWRGSHNFLENDSMQPSLSQKNVWFAQMHTLTTPGFPPKAALNTWSLMFRPKTHTTN